jgi:uncharacterized membrane protein
MTTKRVGSGEYGLESGISLLLIVGVIISLVLEVIGVVIFYRSYGSLNVSQAGSMFIQGHDFFSFIVEQFKKPQENGIPFIIAGIIVLILTPYVRVVASVFYFAREKNIRYVWITLFVLVVITLSLVLH